MATGVKLRNSQVVDGVSFMDLFNIPLTAAQNLSNVLIITGTSQNGKTVVQANYTGASAITLSDYNNLPVGSVIFDFQAFKTHLKTGSTTWKSSAAYT